MTVAGGTSPSARTSMAASNRTTQLARMRRDMSGSSGNERWVSGRSFDPSIVHRLSPARQRQKRRDPRPVLVGLAVSFIYLLLESTADRVERPLLVGKLAGLELRVDQVAVDRELEAATRRGDQPQLTDLLLVL